MKKINLLIVLSSFCFLLSYSQESKLYLGVNVAPSINTLRGNASIETYLAKLSLATNVTLDYFFNENLFLTTGLGYESKGARQESVFTDSSGTSGVSSENTLNFNYLTLPIMYGYSTTGKVKFYIAAGGYLGFLIGQESKRTDFNQFTNSNEESTFDDSDSYKKIDVGVSFLLGLKIPVNERLSLDFSFRDQLGLSNISDLEIIDGGAIKTNSFALQLGVKYGL